MRMPQALGGSATCSLRLPRNSSRVENSISFPKALSWVGSPCSALLHVRRGVLASADFCRPNGSPSGDSCHTRAERQISQGKTRDVHPIHPWHIRRLGLDDIGLRVFWPPRPPADASMPFVFLGPGLRLQLPSDSTSRWTPLLFSSEFPSSGPPEGLAPSTSLPGSLSLAG